MTEKNSRKTSENPPQNPPKSTSVGKAVKYFRGLTNLSQENFAEVCGVGKNTLQRIERGKVKEPHLPTINRIIKGCQNEGLEVDHDIFNAKVVEYEQAAQPNATLNYTEPHYAPDSTKSKQDLTCLLIHIPAARKIVSEISRHNSEMRFVRGITNTLNRIEKMADTNHPFNLEDFSTLMKQLDSFVQEAERKNLKDDADIFSLKNLREKLDGFENELGQFYPEYKDGLIPNDWPCENIKHHNLIEALFSEIQQRKFKLEDINDTDFRNKGLNILEELEIELDRNPLHLKNITTIRARLEELDRDIFKELLISSQLLLGTYAELLPPGSVFRDARTAPELIIIPSGNFLMGSADNEGNEYERPQHEVTIDYRLAVGRFAVTFEEWDFYTSQNPDAHKPKDEGWGRDRRPVINVSWDDAQNYVKWLSETTGQHYRLLSEAEWEYTCRAGTETEFSWGNEISTEQANYDGDYTYGNGAKGEYREKTVPVDSFQPNAWGLYNMHGNIDEWCEDHWHDSYKGAPEDGSAWVGGSDNNENYRVLRGGSWFNDPQYLRARNRYWLSRGDRDGLIGFRVARALASN
ncbi:MAG: SUMF1/EgtB/PvdO family nonheme iron enzyme [Methyloligellaceae bacterium]